MKLLPKARTADIVIQNLNDEVLIYDLKINKAYCLNDTSTKVFNHCDGSTTIENLKRQYKFTDDLIHLALAELKANNLLESYESNHFAGLSRRDVIKKVGLASMIALPVIAGLTAPTAASAASGATVNNTCQTDTDCGSDAPYCVPVNSAMPMNNCCTRRQSDLSPKGATPTGNGYASCDKCTADLGSFYCCSGRATNTSCTAVSGTNLFNCTATCV